MNKKSIIKILRDIESGSLTVKEAVSRLKHLPYEDVGVAMIDHHRELRHGIPEVIFASGKDVDDIMVIADSILSKSGKVLITKAEPYVYKEISPLLKKHSVKGRYFKKSGLIMVGEKKEKTGLVAVLCAGTSDMPIAEEAEGTALFLGSRVEIINDVGVAGLHRLISSNDLIREANVVIVVAGMEGALPSVVGGMTDRPIIAVPTSVGYGTSFGGITALFAMLNSCVPGIAVMNIDNGFGAGVLAHKINISGSQ